MIYISDITLNGLIDHIIKTALGTDNFSYIWELHLEQSISKQLTYVDEKVSLWCARLLTNTPNIKVLEHDYDYDYE